MEDEVFQDSLKEKATNEDIIAAFKGKGVDLEKEFSENESEGELSKEALENVAGGVTLNWKVVTAVWQICFKKGTPYDIYIMGRAYYDMVRYGNPTRRVSADELFRIAKKCGFE